MKYTNVNITTPSNVTKDYSIYRIEFHSCIFKILVTSLKIVFLNKNIVLYKFYVTIGNSKSQIK